MCVVGIVTGVQPLSQGPPITIRAAWRHALCDKWSRTKIALAGGVDVVFELPFCFTVRSAYYFARGALLSLH